MTTAEAIRTEAEKGTYPLSTVYHQGRMDAERKAERALFNPVTNIIMECIKLVGVRNTINYLARCIGTIMIQDFDTTTDPELLKVIEDHTRVSELFDAVRDDLATRRIDKRLQEVKP